MKQVTSLREKQAEAGQKFDMPKVRMVQKDLWQAWALCKVLISALDAEEDNSIHSEAGVARHGFAAEIVTRLIASARDTLIGSGDLPNINWPCAHSLSQALDDAFWHSHSRTESALQLRETRLSIEVLRDEIDLLLQDLESQTGACA